MASRAHRIEIRVTEAERALGEAAASATGETLSEFVRRAARSEAEAVLAERTSYVVDDDAAARFLAALDSPSAAIEQRLRRLLAPPDAPLDLPADVPLGE
jgi:uncharacterized protein (DUF1778 family)